MDPRALSAFTTVLAFAYTVASDLELVDEVLGVVAQLHQDRLSDLLVDVVVEQHGLVACRESLVYPE